MLPFDQSLVIIPTYNEIENIEAMIRRIFEISSDFSILVIDDGSPDGTGACIHQLKAEFPNLFLVERSGKLGLGTAYLHGFQWGLNRGFNFIFEIDADFSHNPEDLPRLLLAAQNHDLVIGSRYIDGIRVINWPFQRLLLSYGASIYVRLITGLKVIDTTGGFKCFNRRALESLNLDQVFCNGYAFQLEVNYRLQLKGLRIIEVPIIFTERRIGKSKMGLKIVLEAIYSVWKLRFLQLAGKL